MKWLVIILFFLICDNPDSLRTKDSTETKLNLIYVQQKEMIKQLDSLKTILKIDSTKRKK